MSSKGWVSDIINACIAAGVQEFVVCAGARNLGLVAALAEHAEAGDVRIFSHFEERAAGFFALGRITQTGDPCAVVTTSGTAVAELLPVVIEAHYQQRPLVLISADRPIRFRGTGAPQAIEQAELFGNYVAGAEDIAWQDDLTLFAGWTGVSSWHLNICLEENETQGDPRFSKIRLGMNEPPRTNLDMLPALDCLRDAWRGLVVLLGGLEPEDREEVWHFLRDLGAPVLADTTSGLREALGSLALVDGDRILRESPPAHVIRIGDVPIGRFWRDLETLDDVNVVSISRTGFPGLARENALITGEIPRCLRALGEVPHVGDSMDYLKISQKKRGRIAELLESLPESEPGMVRQISVLATMGSSLYLGNSLPIREWNDFAQQDVPYELVSANRGANGIDGQIATWLGNTADQQDAWGLVGDLTAMYDFSAPALLGQVECRGRMLVVINNGGGRIFDRLPTVRHLGDTAAGLISNGHKHSFEHWASMWGMDYACIKGIEGFDVEPSEKTTLVELQPDPEQTARFWDKLNSL